MQQLARDEAGNIFEIDAQGNPIRLVQPAQQQARGQVFSLPNPQRDAQVVNTQANTDRTQFETAQAKATADAARRKAEADASKAEAEARLALQGTTPEQRNNVLGSYRAIDNLQRSINEMADLYRAGPGATKGIAGLGDYMPTTANQRFDNAGNSARGFVGTALGLTASQNNTEKESGRNIGPYIPSSWDRDPVILDKIRRLQGLVDEARSSAQNQLGAGAPAAGIAPSDSTREILGISPPAASQPPSGGGGPGGGGPDRGEMLLFNDQAAPTTGVRMSPQQEAQIGAALRSGDAGLALDLFQKFTGNPPSADTVAGVNAAIKAFKANPKAQVGINYGAVDSAAKQAEDAKRFGGQLPQALLDRAGASGLDVTARGLANGFLGGLPDYAAAGIDTLMNGGGYQGNLNRERALTEADARLSGTNSALSTIVGGAGGALTGEAMLTRALPGAMKFAAPMMADAGYGALTGYTSADQGQGGTGALVGGLFGAGGGIAGRKVASATGAALKGVTDPAVQYLRDKGVRLTLGQLAGGSIKGIEDRLSGYPILGDAVNNLRNQGISDFNRASFRRQAETAGQVAKDTIGGQGVENAFQNASNAYDSALGGRTIPTGPQMIGDMLPPLRLGASNPKYGQDFRSLINTDIAPLAPNIRRNMTGQEYQDVDRALQGLEADYRAKATGLSPEPVARSVSKAFAGLGDALDANVARNAPDILPAYMNAKQSYREAGILRDAVNAARNGTRSGQTEAFMPSQLSDAAAANARRFGGTQGTTNIPFYELSRYGQQVLPSKVADSGTAGRLAIPLLLGAGSGTDQGLGALGVDSDGMGLGTALALSAMFVPQTKAGRLAVDKLLAARTPAMRKLGENIINNNVAGGLIGASIAPRYVAPLATTSLLPPQ